MSKNFIAGAIKRPGQLHRDLGIPEDQEIPYKTLVEASKRKDKVGQRARLAITLKRMNQA